MQQETSWQSWHQVRFTLYDLIKGEQQRAVSGGKGQGRSTARPFVTAKVRGERDRQECVCSVWFPGGLRAVEETEGDTFG